MMNLDHQQRLMLTRRQLLGHSSVGIGTAALASLLNPAKTHAVGGGSRTGGIQRTRAWRSRTAVC